MKDKIRFIVIMILIWSLIPIIFTIIENNNTEKEKLEELNNRIQLLQGELDSLNLELLK